MSLFKIKVPVKYHNNNCKISTNGEWFDLRTSQTIEFKAPSTSKGKVSFDTGFIDLGITLKVPKGFEANIVARSSTLLNYGVIQWNSYGVIDQTYSGPKDIFKFGYIAIKEGIINEGERVAQFRLNLSQKSNWWQKLKWLFSKIEFVEVDEIDTPSRGGFGSSGKN